MAELFFPLLRLQIESRETAREHVERNVWEWQKWEKIREKEAVSSGGLEYYIYALPPFAHVFTCI